MSKDGFNGYDAGEMDDGEVLLEEEDLYSVEDAEGAQETGNGGKLNTVGAEWMSRNSVDITAIPPDSDLELSIYFCRVSVIGRLHYKGEMPLVYPPGDKINVPRGVFTIMLKKKPRNGGKVSVFYLRTVVYGDRDIEILQRLKKGTFIHAEGSLSSYRNVIQLNATQIIPILSLEQRLNDWMKEGIDMMNDGHHVVKGNEESEDDMDMGMEAEDIEVSGRKEKRPDLLPDEDDEYDIDEEIDRNAAEIIERRGDVLDALADIIEDTGITPAKGKKDMPKRLVNSRRPRRSFL